MAKRENKSSGGANSYCRHCHQPFFVRWNKKTKESNYRNILVSPQELRFQYVEGSAAAPSVQNVDLTRETSDMAPSWHAQADNWITFSPSTGGKVPANLRVRPKIDIKSWLPGTYRGELIIVTPNGVSILPSPVVTIVLEIQPKESPQPEPTEPPTEPTEPEPEPTEPTEPPQPPEESQWQRFWNWLLELLRRIFG